MVGRALAGISYPAMKAKLTISIDQELIPRAKRFACGRGLSLSELVETSLRTVTAEEEGPSFSERWRGKFQSEFLLPGCVCLSQRSRLSLMRRSSR
jgi:hypothetical protein